MPSLDWLIYGGIDLDRLKLSGNGPKLALKKMLQETIPPPLSPCGRGIV